MRMIAFAIMFSFLLTGYAAAANAFGLSVDCPMKAAAGSMDMSDCPMHKQDQAPAKNCDSCGDCCVLVTSIIPPAVAEMPELSVVVHDVLPVKELSLNLLYPPFHPPDLLA